MRRDERVSREAFTKKASVPTGESSLVVFERRHTRKHTLARGFSVSRSLSLDPAPHAVSSPILAEKETREKT